MKRFLLYFGLTASLITVSSAQPGAGGPTFEVASIKRGALLPDGTAPPCTGGPGTSQPALFRCPCKSMAFLAQFAFNVTTEGLDGPSWMGDYSTCYDISAKVLPGATRDQLRLMLQNLLAERFHLASHHETRAVLTYTLVVAPDGPKLKAAKIKPASDDPSGDGTPLAKKQASGQPWAVSVAGGGYYRLTATSMDLKSLAAALEGSLRSPVVDETGLAGSFQFTLDYLPPGAPEGLNLSNENGHPVTDIASALQPQLGLKLKMQKLPKDVVVIDHIDKKPTEN